MTKCPYPEILIDETSGATVSSDQYKYWHEGYEANKIEILDLSRKLAILTDLYSKTLAKVPHNANEFESDRDVLLKLKKELKAQNNKIAALF
jgi:hypothetical protein